MTDSTPEQLECVEVIIAAESAEWLADFTRSLVEGRLVACGHNISPMRAIYRWEGKVYDEIQARAALHTRAALVSKVTEIAIQKHPDDVPCIIATQLIAGNRDYFNWIYSETAASNVAPRAH